MTSNNHPAHGPVSLERLHQIREILSKASAQSDGGNLGYAMADAVKVIDVAIAAFGAEPVPCPKCNDTGMADSGGVHPWGEPILIECDCRADTLHDEPVSNSDELPLDYLQGHKDGLKWAAQLAEANHPQTGDWLYDDPIALAAAIRKGPDMPPAQTALAVDADDNFYSWFGREWDKYYQPNNYSLSAKKHLGAIAESAWFACRSAMLQAGNSPVTQDGWIPVSERMPEDEQEVLTRNRMGHCFVSFFDEHSGLFFDRVDVAAACCIEHILVTHWMPLPAAPQQEVKSE